jgi:hypothetical protein
LENNHSWCQGCSAVAGHQKYRTTEGERMQEGRTESTCDLCEQDWSGGPAVAVTVSRGGERFGSFCSRWCAVHALLATLSRDVADGPSALIWRADTIRG